MSFTYEVLKANFKAITKQGKVKDNRANRFSEFVRAVKQTRIEEGDIANLGAISTNFKSRLEASNDWGSVKVHDELEAVLAALPPATN